ncbi:hypothetical protein E2562_034636 [Oryza meyeriana var. granulata]|uniref:Uncharacterized protein n=1 Tax=Oryza meyeriana var. granulata TaxID=110450 RepID=A0A6G1F1C5_9ORYZ|nr:hypothetical protein E2562_034636 [Oryza meyeriana var. granulata]
MATALASHVESWARDTRRGCPVPLLCRARAVDALGCHELALTDALALLGSGNPRVKRAVGRGGTRRYALMG